MKQICLQCKLVFYGSARKYCSKVCGYRHQSQMMKRKGIRPPSRLGIKHTKETKRKIGLANSIALKGHKPTLEARKNMSLSKRGETNYLWKGENVGYRALHKWVEGMLGKPDTCEHCGKSGLTHKKVHWANKSHQYKRDLTDWLRLCVPCHKAYDKGI